MAVLYVLSKSPDVPVSDDGLDFFCKVVRLSDVLWIARANGPDLGSLFEHVFDYVGSNPAQALYYNRTNDLVSAVYDRNGYGHLCYAWDMIDLVTSVGWKP